MNARIAVLITCHNRREHTLRCLQSLMAQRDVRAHVDVVVVDAASTDGTPEAIRARFPDVTLLSGTEDLYWNAGMRLAFIYATKSGYDYYLWLNDDTFLDEDALIHLLETMQAVHDTARPAIVVGSTRSSRSGRLTYGGLSRRNPLRPTRFFYVEPADTPRQCETMNGNCVLISRSVVKRVGVLDSAFSHGLGDYDYGLRAVRAGCRVWVAPSTVATCDRNDMEDQPATTLRNELRHLRSEKGLPFAEWRCFTRRWTGWKWPIYAVSPYIRRLAAAARR